MTRPVDRLWNNRRFILAAGDAVIFCGVLGVTMTLRDPSGFPDPSGFGAALILPFLPVLSCLVIAAYAAGLYELRVIRDFVSLNGGLLGSSVACAVFGTTYFYLLAPYLKFSPKITLLLIVMGTHVGMLVWRRALLSATGFRLVDLKILILGDADYRDELVTSLECRSSGDFKMVRCVGPDVDLVVVDRHWTDRHPDEATRTLAAAVASLIPIVSINEFHESLFGRVSPHHANDLAWALDHVLPRSGSLYFTTKRVLDVIAASVLLVLVAPVVLVVAAAIFLEDCASPMYGQLRVGYLGRPFRLWKFRTMRHDADLQGPFIQTPGEDDPRVTRLGSLLRRLRIDELPQLWNVLKGDMSIVGPRPEWIKEVEILEKRIPTYSLRYLVPPGITGWAQVYFRATSNPQDATEKHNYDLYYLKHFSLALDLSIMLKTIKRVVTKELRGPSLPVPAVPERETSSKVAVDIASIVGRT